MITGLPVGYSGLGLRRSGVTHLLLSAQQDMTGRYDVLREHLPGLRVPDAAEVLLDEGSPAPRFLIAGLDRLLAGRLAS